MCVSSVRWIQAARNTSIENIYQAYYNKQKMQNDSFDKIFLENSISVMFNTFDLDYTIYKRASFDVEKPLNSAEIPNDFIYVKKIDIDFTIVKGSIAIAFNQQMLPRLYENCEEEIKIYFYMLNLDALLSNVLGLLLYSVHKKVKITHSFEFSLPKTVTLHNLTMNNNLLSFRKENTIVSYLGFTFSEGNTLE